MTRPLALVCATLLLFIAAADARADAALDALSQWTFRPARRAGVAIPSFVYIVFGFAEIVGNK